MMSSRNTAELSAHDRDFCKTNSGIATRMLLDSSAVSAAEVAERRQLSPSTVRHYKAARKLYCYPVNGKLPFPAWQSKTSATARSPHWGTSSKPSPSNLHPEAVAGFFLTPQPDLVLNGEPVSAKEWLQTGGSMEIIVGLAEDLATGY
jgi:hypothetical protein